MKRFGIQFSERMAGRIHFNNEPDIDYPFEFTIRVFSTEFLRPFSPRKISGTSFWPGHPSAERFPLTGVLAFNFSGVSYDFSTQLPDRREVRVIGTKSYVWTVRSWKRFRDSLTTLYFKVFLYNEPDLSPIATGIIRYLDPLYSFVFSIRFRRIENAFASGQKKLANRIAKFAPILLPNDSTRIPQDALIQSIEQQLESVSGKELLGLSVLFEWVRRVGQLEQKLNHSRILRKMIVPFSTLIYSGVYQRKNKNIPLSSPEPERWMSQNIRPTVVRDSRGPNSPIEADVVIVGSGAGGAACAERLARQGYAVVVIEEGHYYKRSDFTGRRLEMMSKLYRNGGLSFALSNSLVWLPTGKCVGGSTTINCGTSFPTPPQILERWAKTLGLRDLGLEQYCREVEEFLQVKPVDRPLLGTIANVLEMGVRETSYTVSPLPRGEVGCDGQAQCILGCPTDAKRSANVSYLPEALKKGAMLLTRYRAQQILPGMTGIRAGVEGYEDDFEIQVHAKITVLALGALGTPAFLKANGIGKNLPHLGRNLTIHPALTMGAVFDRRMSQEMYVPQSLGIFGTENLGFVLEGHTLSPDQIAVCFPLWARKLENLMHQSDQFVNFSAMLTDCKTGRTWGSVPVYGIDRDTAKRLKDAAVILGRIFFRGGAKSVYAPIYGFEVLESPEDIERLEKADLRGWDFEMLSAYHPLGTCRMGDSPQNSVVDRNGAVWGYPNLHIVDGSVIPGPLGVNPQVTIMSNAARIADYIGENL